MSTAAVGMLAVSIVGGVIAIIIGLVAAYNKDKWYAIVSGVTVLVAMGICWGCWIFLPRGHDQEKEWYIKQQYRERVYEQYRKCSKDCLDECLERAEERLAVTADRDGKVRRARWDSHDEADAGAGPELPVSPPADGGLAAPPPKSSASNATTPSRP